MVLRRRILISGGVAAAIYLAFAIVFVAVLGLDEADYRLAIPISTGAAIAFVVGSLLFGLIPHLLGSFMEMGASGLDVLNRASLAVALISIAVGLIAALALIGGVTTSVKPLLVAIAFFVASSATMCSLRFFYINRARE